jgi:hypothetical protein
MNRLNNTQPTSETPYRGVVSIHGVPRSGTTWLGTIFDSHPDVAFRFQPLFAYRFKDRIKLESSAEDIDIFLKELYAVNDDAFILRYGRGVEPHLLDFRKRGSPLTLVFKEVRYHHLIQKFLEAVDKLKVVGIVRNPCAVINSWLQAPKEFKKGWQPLAEWRYAPSKNLGRIEEYNGFEKWKEATYAFLKLQQQYPGRFYLIQYEQLVSEPIRVIEDAFSFVGLRMEDQVMDFIRMSQSRHSDDAYALFKSPGVKERWRAELDPGIADEIITDLKGTALERFLV